MFKQIEICDKCKASDKELYHYTVPYPETLIAAGGKGNIPMIQFHGLKDKEIALCEDCRMLLKEYIMSFLA